MAAAISKMMQIICPIAHTDSGVFFVTFVAHFVVLSMPASNDANTLPFIIYYSFHYVGVFHLTIPYPDVLFKVFAAAAVPSRVI